MPNIFQMSLLMMFHPKDALDIIKRERRVFRPLRVFLLMLALAVVNYTYNFYVNYILAAKALEQVSILLDLALAFLPIITLIVLMVVFRWGASKAAPVGLIITIFTGLIFYKANIPLLAIESAKGVWYAITAIIVGECSFTELLTASTYCLVPVIVIKPFLGLMSLVLTTDEAGIYNGLLVITYIWMLILLFLALQRLNDYSVKKTVCVVFIAIIAMLIIWGVIILIFTLFAQVVGFIQDILREVKLKY